MEKWKPIIGFDGYQVSSLGRIKSTRKIVKKYAYKSKGVYEPIEFITKTIIRKTQLNNNGYEIVGLSKQKKIHWLSVHRLVASAFLPNPLKKPCVNHKNFNRKDNRVENLEWCSHAENVDYSYENISRANRENIKHFRRVRCIETGEIYKSCTEAAKKMNCSVSLISNAATKYNGHNKARNLHWEFIK